MKLFEYAVIFNPLPTEDQVKRGERPKAKLIVPITELLANDEKEASMIAARAIPEDYINQLDRVQIAIRPF